MHFIQVLTVNLMTIVYNQGLYYWKKYFIHIHDDVDDYYSIVVHLTFKCENLSHVCIDYVEYNSRMRT